MAEEVTDFSGEATYVIFLSGYNVFVKLPSKLVFTTIDCCYQAQLISASEAPENNGHL